MGTIYRGETKKFVINIKDANGNIITPANLLNMKVFIYDMKFGQAIASYSINAEDGFSPLAIQDTTVNFVLDQPLTRQAKAGNYIIQINLYIYDPSFPDNTRVSIQKGQFSTFTDAKQ